MEESDDGVAGFHRQGFLVLEVDTQKAKHMGVNWLDLGGFGKRKYENYLYIKYARNNPKIIYV
jgi:hypothetical protein